MSATGRPEREYRSAKREGSPVSAAGPSQGRLRERGEAKARGARPRARAAADREMLRIAHVRAEAAWNSSLSEGRRAAPRVHQ